MAIKNLFLRWPQRLQNLVQVIAIILLWLWTVKEVDKTRWEYSSGCIWKDHDLNCYIGWWSKTFPSGGPLASASERPCAVSLFCLPRVEIMKEMDKTWWEHSSGYMWKAHDLDCNFGWPSKTFSWGGISACKAWCRFSLFWLPRAKPMKKVDKTWSGYTKEYIWNENDLGCNYAWPSYTCCWGDISAWKTQVQVSLFWLPRVETMKEMDKTRWEYSSGCIWKDQDLDCNIGWWSKTFPSGGISAW